MKRQMIASCAGLVLALGGVTACTAQTEAGDPGPAPNEPAAEASASESEAPAEESEAPAEEPAGPAVATWGEAFTYEDGLVVTLSQPTGYTPSETAAGTDGFTSFVRVDVTITNGTSDVYEPTLFLLDGTSGGVAMSQVFDIAQGMTLAPTAAVLPGQSITFAAAFGVADPADLTFDVMPGFEYDSVYFQGGAA